MATNVEIKARVRDAERVHAAAAALSGAPGEAIPQHDVFFHAPRGRLKLRILAPEHGQLIHYQRDDVVGPKRSEYVIADTAEPATLQAVLTAALGVRGEVRKQRMLYRVGQTRIHVDEVDGLGSFLELEVVLGEGQSPAHGRRVADELMDALGVGPDDLVEGAYIDLLECG